MKILNIHERLLPADYVAVGALLDSLSSPDDRLWPRGIWPTMRFDRPLTLGAVGGHGPIRYRVEGYTAGERVVFRFTGPSGLVGTHRFELIPQGATGTLLRHTVDADSRGAMILAWPLLFGPLHDALLEDGLATAQASLGLEAEITPWSPWVRVVRRLAAGRNARPQRIEPKAKISG